MCLFIHCFCSFSSAQCYQDFFYFCLHWHYLSDFAERGAPKVPHPTLEYNHQPRYFYVGLFHGRFGEWQHKIKPFQWWLPTCWMLSPGRHAWNNLYLFLSARQRLFSLSLNLKCGIVACFSGVRSVSPHLYYQFNSVFNFLLHFLSCRKLANKINK